MGVVPYCFVHWGLDLYCFVHWIRSLLSCIICVFCNGNWVFSRFLSHCSNPKAMIVLFNFYTIRICLHLGIVASLEQILYVFLKGLRVKRD